MRLALIQMNPTIGDMPGNAAIVAARAGDAARGGADLIVFPELALTGYPPRDLLLHEGFLDAVRREALALAARPALAAATVMLGAPWKPRPSDPVPGSWDEAARITNSVLVLRNGRIDARYDKRLLPTYDVFDEDRYFRPGDRPLVIEVAGVRVGVSVCEDLWRGFDAGVASRYEGRADPVDELVALGAQLIVNPSASPFVVGKGRRQRDILTSHVLRHGVAVAAVNQVGGNDDLIFDGHAAAYIPVGSATSRSARLIAAGPGFDDGIVIIDLPADPAAWPTLPEVRDPLLTSDDMSHLWRALVLGVRDYCRKTGFSRALIGVSGGIDSAVVAAIAAAALGPSNVLGVAMPSRYSSPGSVTDAKALADATGIGFIEVPIREPHRVVTDLLQPAYRAIGAPNAEVENDLTDENLQSRLRGLSLMAISNKTGAILLTTGNKSELAVGYCTLYGDMNGGLAVLSDVPKVDVYRLARWVNANAAACGFARAPIPESTITKPPSAELRPDQKDQDSLPPYEVLDAVIERYVEKMQSPSRIARETGIDAALVAKIARMIDGAEFKRKQMPIGLKVTGVAFGRGRRRPVVQRFREQH